MPQSAGNELALVFPYVTKHKKASESIRYMYVPITHAVNKFNINMQSIQGNYIGVSSDFSAKKLCT